MAMGLQHKQTEGKFQDGGDDGPVTHLDVLKCLKTVFFRIL